MVGGVGRSTDPSTATRRDDLPVTKEPASIRYNNPGAQYPSARAAAFGQTGYGIIGGGHKIARFPSPVNGAAANFDLLCRHENGAGGQEVDWFLRLRYSRPCTHSLAPAWRCRPRSHRRGPLPGTPARIRTPHSPMARSSEDRPSAPERRICTVRQYAPGRASANPPLLDLFLHFRSDVFQRFPVEINVGTACLEHFVRLRPLLLCQRVALARGPRSPS